MRVQLSLRAEKLKNVEKKLKGVSDPYATATISGGLDEGTEIGRTETIENCLNPSWTTILFLEYNPGTQMPLRVAIYDDNSDRGKDDKLMGEFDFDVADVINSSSKEQHEDLPRGGRVYIHVDESIKGNALGKFEFQLRGLSMHNVETGVMGLGKSDPFYEISKKFSDPSSGIVRWIVVYRSEWVKDNLNPFWGKGSIGLEELCNADLECPIKIDVFDWEKHSKHRKLGSFETTVSTLMSRTAKRGNADRENAYQLFLGEKKETGRGFVVVLKAEIV